MLHFEFNDVTRDENGIAHRQLWVTQDLPQSETKFKATECNKINFEIQVEHNKVDV